MATKQPPKPRKTATPKAPVPRMQNAGDRISPQEIRQLIEEAAYYKAKQRGFAPGHELEDWIAAEAEVRRRLEP